MDRRIEMPYEVVIGLEVHARLLSRTKMFCADESCFGGGANSRTCPVCLGLPGALPVINRHAVNLALKAALAVNCSVHETSLFARKNYFYPDLPKGYQISQFEKPLAEDGYLEIETKGRLRRIGIDRIHLEEDAGKNTHPEGEDFSLVDYNRCGTPLIEIVSKSEIQSAEEASIYLKKLHHILRWLDVCDGNMEQGSFRCDANVSLRPAGTEGLGARTELKNINSFRFVKKGLEVEIERQTVLLNAGRKVRQGTRLYNSATQQTHAMRGKEESPDYRYFPDPDLLPLRLETRDIEHVRSELPELPEVRLKRLIEEYSLSDRDADILLAEREVADYFEDCLKAGAPAKAAANWVLGAVLARLKSKEITIGEFSVSPENLASLIAMIGRGRISSKIAKAVFADMARTGEAASRIVDANSDYRLLDDPEELSAIVDSILVNQPDFAEKLQAGDSRICGAIVGRVMAITRGRADPGVVNRLVTGKLSQPD